MKAVKHRLLVHQMFIRPCFEICWPANGYYFLFVNQSFVFCLFECSICAESVYLSARQFNYTIREQFKLEFYILKTIFGMMWFSSSEMVLFGTLGVRGEDFNFYIPPSKNVKKNALEPGFSNFFFWWRPKKMLFF